MSEAAKYLVYLIEQYALHKNMSGDEVFFLFEDNSLIPYIYKMYYTYHTERVENAIDDIDRMLAKTA